MMRDDQPEFGAEGKPDAASPVSSPNPPRAPAPAQVSFGCCALPRRTAQALGLAIALAACLAAGWMFLRDGSSNGTIQGPDGGTQAPRPSLFLTWPKGVPEVAIVLSAQTDGYDQPCGCSDPQYGGLARRYNFIQSLRAKGWPVAAFDLGDIAQRRGVHKQKLLKYVTAMKALKFMDYTAVGVGRNEFYLPLTEGLAEYALNEPKPAVLAANLLDPNKDFVDMVRASEVAAPKGAPRVGAIGLIGRSVEKAVTDANHKFADNAPVLLKNLQQLKGRADLVVVLYQGTVAEAKLLAGYCAGLSRKDSTLPPVNVIVCLTEDEEPPSAPERAKDASDTLIVAIGHKGKYVGIVGAFRADGGKQPYKLEYELALMAPEFQTPKGKETDNPVMVLMEEYAREIARPGKDGKRLLDLTPRGKHPVQVEFPQARYVGSERCADCHERAYQVWEKSGHSHAYDTLVKAKNPSLRQYDPECVTCHTVGFQHESGWNDPANDAKRNLKLLHVGCESCHGPASIHVNNVGNPAIDAKLLPLMNPWKKQANNPLAEKIRLTKIDDFCMKCHDQENDVNWAKVPFLEKWKLIEHMTPPRKQIAAPKAQAPQGARREQP
jgi:hypothetical protein